MSLCRECNSPTPLLRVQHPNTTFSPAITLQSNEVRTHLTCGGFKKFYDCLSMIQSLFFKYSTTLKKIHDLTRSLLRPVFPDIARLRLSKISLSCCLPCKDSTEWLMMIITAFESFFKKNWKLTQLYGTSLTSLHVCRASVQ